MSFSSTARTGVLAIALAGAMTLGVGAAKPAVAWGETLEDLQAKVEQTNDALNTANDKVAQLQQQIDDNQQRISEIEAQLPDARATAAQSIRAQYKMQQGSQGLVELILSSDSFYDFLSTIQFLDSVTSYNTDQIQSLVDLINEKVQLSGQAVLDCSAYKVFFNMMYSGYQVLMKKRELRAVPDGVYLLDAAPLNLGGADGAPCRAVLIEI